MKEKKASFLTRIFNKYKRHKKGIPLKISAFSDVGKVRQNNEDSFYITPDFIIGQEPLVKPRAIYAVMDGMGGEAYGEVASQTAKKTLADYEAYYLSMTDISDENIENMMNEYATKANAEICDALAALSDARGGTTFAGIVSRGKDLFICHVGDSRVYMFHDNELQQMTQDQTLAERKLQANIYTKDDPAYKKESHILTNFLGIDKEERVLKMTFTPAIHAQRGDKFLICSDGLTDMCSDAEIAALLQAPDCTADTLGNQALTNGGVDNVTCILLEVL